MVRPYVIPDESAEVERSRAMTDREREEILVIVVRSAARLLAERPDRDQALRRTDPLPASTLAALARLRQRRTSR